MPRLPASFLRRLLLALTASLFLLSTAVVTASAEDALDAIDDDAVEQVREEPADKEPPVRPIRTDSPRDTLATFIRLRFELETMIAAYGQVRTAEVADYIVLLLDQFAALIDLSEQPSASRRKIGVETTAYLLDVLGRIELPPLETIPDAEFYGDEEGVVKWRIPRTPIRIARIDEGPREGEFLFSARTVRAAPRFYRAVEDVPLETLLPIESWSRTIPQLTGPMIPAGLIRAVPDELKEPWLDTPAWKVLALLLLAALIGFLVKLLFSQLSRSQPKGRFASLLWRTLQPLVILAVTWLLILFIYEELNITGRFSAVVETITTVAVYVGLAWLFWLGIRAFFEWIILSPRIPQESLDANLLRLFAGLLGVIGVVLIVAYGGQEIGLPVLSILAGLGIGGLAVALAIRPTLENLIGGVILYIDKPVRVGDFCSFGSYMGTVENIGIRSTQLRALDRTQITVPNAQFADMQIVNWAQCDQMLIEHTIGVRYETTPDQLRYLLAKIREMLHAHPRIDSDSIRVRFSGYGDSSLNITIRIYAMTREWNAWHAIREDVLLRVYDIITEAGSGFAFPSRTLYMGQDEGLDSERGKTAMERVKAWRRSGKLPFPRLPAERLEQLKGTLDYPPRGSPEAGGEVVRDTERAERLSAEPLSTPEPDAETHEDGSPEEKKHEKDPTKT